MHLRLQKISAKRLMRFIIIALACFAVGQFQSYFVTQPKGIPFIYPAGGVALAVLLLSPWSERYILLGLIFTASSFVNLASGDPLPISAANALADTLEVALVFWLLTRFVGRKITFTRPAEVLGLVIIVFIVNGCTNLVEIALPALTGSAPLRDTWINMWIVESLGMLVVTQLIVTWAQAKNLLHNVSLRRGAEALIMLLLVVGASWVMFGESSLYEYVVFRPHMLFPFLIGAAIRFSPRTAITCVFLIAAIALGNTASGLGNFPLGGETYIERIIYVDAFLLIASFTTMLLSANLTERKQSQEQNAALVHIFDESLNEIYIFDADTLKFLLVNEGALKNLGYSSVELNELTPLDVKPDYTRETFIKMITPLRRGEIDHISLETRHRRKDGSLYPIQVQLQQSHFDGKTVFVATAMDITERKQADDALRESETRFRTLFEHAAVGVALNETKTGRFIDVNQNYCDFLGYTKEEMLHLAFPDITFPDDAQKDNENTALLLAGNIREFSLEKRYIRKDGSVVWGELTVSPLWAPGEEPSDYLHIAVVQDITERKQADDALRESESRFHTLFEHAAVGVSLNETKTGRFIDINQSFCDFLGYTKEEVLNMPYQAVTYPDDVQENVKNNALLLAGKIREFTIEKRFICKDGSIVWGELTVSPLWAPGEEPSDYLHIGVVQDITERKQADDALRESETRFRTLFEQAAVGVALVKTKTGRFADINQNYCDFLGYTREEMLHLTFHDITYPDDVRENIENNALLLAGKIREFSLEKRYIRKDGSVVWGELTASPLWAPGEKPAEYLHIAVVQDITERKQADDALRESETRFRTLFEHATMGVALLETKTGHFIDINQSYCDFLGYTREEMLHLTFKDITYPDDAQENIDKIALLLAGEIREFTIEKRFIRKDGGMAWGELTVSPLWAPGEEPSIYLHIGMVQNITKRKQAEQAMRESEVRYQALFENVGDGVSLVDSEERVILANPAAEIIFGVPPGALVGRDLREFMTPEQITMVREQTRQRQAGKKSAYEIEIRRLDGENRHLLLNAVPHTDSRGRFLGTFGIYHDITQRKRTEEALQESEERYQSLFHDAPVALWQEDFSEVKRQMDRLKKKGVKDFREYFAQHPGSAARFSALVKIVDLNQAALVLHQAGCKEALMTGLNTIFGEEALPIFIEEIIALAEGKMNFEGELVERTLAGDRINVIVRLSVAPGCEETWSKTLISTTDITDRKRVEQQIKDALAEKDTLLRELYHRTKNNMQVIIALLELKSAIEVDPRVRQTFLETTNRILSMAMVHQKLYRSQNLSSIDLGEYISDLAETLGKSYLITPDQVTITVQTEETPVSIDTAIPCGLLVNEILSNAFKYAFPQGRKGEIKVRISKVEEHVILLEISDNGVGIPPEVDLELCPTLGMQIITGITESQLGGKAELERKDGVTWRIHFADDRYGQRL
jgi:PAS domain S-box-containing protein